MARAKSQPAIDVPNLSQREDGDFNEYVERVRVREAEPIKPEFEYLDTIKVFRGADVAIVNECEIEVWKRNGWSTTPGGGR